MKSKKSIRIVTILLFLASFFQIQAQKNKEQVKFPEIGKEIVAMRDADQKLRIKWAKLVKKGKTDSKQYKEVSQKLRSIDENNTNRIREIVRKYGWPTYDLVGRGPSNSAWLLVQHANRNPLVQMECLPLLKEAVDKGQANPRNYAYLYDRVQVAKGEKQLYATQSTTNNGIKKGSFQAIEDESNVQKRREEMGIDLHIEDYAKSMGFDYRVPTPEEAIRRAQALVDSYELNLGKAKQAMQEKDYDAAAKYYTDLTRSDGLVEAKDFVEIARATSLAKLEDSPWAFYYLIKAAVRGWEGINEFNTDEDFSYIKAASPENWKALMNVVEELNNTN